MDMLRTRRAAAPPAALAVALLAVALLAGTAACGARREGARRESSQPAAVQAAFSRAIRADMSFGSPSAAYRDRALAALRAGRKEPALTAATLSKIRASGKAAIARSFGQPQAAAELTRLGKDMTADTAPNVVNLGSGVSTINFRKVAIAGASATVDAQVTVWAKSLARQAPNGPWLTAAPVNVMDYTATLTRHSSGPWHVTHWTGTFAPGGGP